MSYNILNDATRNENYGTVDLTDDPGYSNNLSPDWKGPGWYRFQSPAGDKMADTYVAKYHCGTRVAYWINGEHPTNVGETVTRTVCGSWSTNCQGSTSIQIKKCGSYFLYDLPNVPKSYGRYCGRLEGEQSQ